MRPPRSWRSLVSSSSWTPCCPVSPPWSPGNPSRDPGGGIPSPTPSSPSWSDWKATGRPCRRSFISGKVTFVHRHLWPAVAGVASAREPWQVEGFSPEEARLLRTVEDAGWVRTDEADRFTPLDLKAVRRAAKRLERNLLVVSREIHTETGAHARVLETWEAWAQRIGFREPWKASAEGRRELEAVLGRANRRFGAEGRLPWQSG